MAINLIRISGKQVCDYIWCVESSLSEGDEDKLKDIGYEPSWTLKTNLLGTFNDNLETGNINSGESVVSGWKIFREYSKNGVTIQEPAAVVRGDDTSIIDYAVKNKADYRYLITAESGQLLTSALRSDVISTDWDGYFLFSVDDTEYKNEFVFHEGFSFELNAVVGQMSNNLEVEMHSNFSRYPKVHKGRQKYMSGTLSSILGRVDFSIGKMEVDADLETRLSDFTNDSRRKFLRDYKGHFFEVEVSAPLTLQPYNGSDDLPYEVQISWVQVCDVKNTVITNK